MGTMQGTRVGLHGKVSLWHKRKVDRIQRKLGLSQVQTLCLIIEAYPEEGDKSAATPPATNLAPMTPDWMDVSSLDREVMKVRAEVDQLHELAVRLHEDHEMAFGSEFAKICDESGIAEAKAWFDAKVARFESAAKATIAARRRGQSQEGGRGNVGSSVTRSN